MKTNIFITAFASIILLMACTNDDGQSPLVADLKNPYETPLDRIAASNSTTGFQSHITTTNGTEINDVSQLSLGTDYYLIIEGELPAFFRIGLKGGFDLIENLNDLENPVTTAKYLIRPVDEIANGLAVSIIVIHKVENKLLREPPKRFIMLE